MSVQTLNELKQYLNKENVTKIEPPLLGIDYGERRVGLAVTDRNGIIATPLDIVPVGKTDYSQLDRKILEVIEAYQIKTIVIGIPQEFVSSHSKTTEKILKFQQHIEQLTNMDIFLYDESYSTVNSYTVLREQGQKQKKSKRKIDKIASAYFLQELIDFKKIQDEK